MVQPPSILGTLTWVPPGENGPTMPFDVDQITSFAYVGDDRTSASALVVRGLAPGGAAGPVTASWVESYPELAVGAGDVITLMASQRPIATISVTGLE